METALTGGDLESLQDLVMVVYEIHHLILYVLPRMIRMFALPPCGTNSFLPFTSLHANNFL